MSGQLRVDDQSFALAGNFPPRFSSSTRMALYISPSVSIPRGFDHVSAVVNFIDDSVFNGAFHFRILSSRSAT
jgi:hypothetical protein